MSFKQFFSKNNVFCTLAYHKMRHFFFETIIGTTFDLNYLPNFVYCSGLTPILTLIP